MIFCRRAISIHKAQLLRRVLVITKAMLAINFSPYPELTTARLHLRCINKTDITEIFTLRTDKRVLQFLGRDPMASEKEASGFIDMVLDTLQKNEGILWVITHKDSDILIGTIGYWRIIKDHDRAEVGYQLSPAEWGKGIMKEALLKVIDYGFKTMNLHSIEANIHPGNLASARLLESCGFMKEGYFRESYFHNGKYSDAAIYSLLSSDQPAKK